MRLLSVVFAVGVLSLAGQAQAESADWLTNMAQAVRTQNYQGVIVYAQGGRMESMRITHRYRDGREQERLQALSGEAREIHRDNDVVTCILPKDRAVKIDRRAFRGLLPALNRATVEAISDHYEFQQVGSGKILGRSCRAVSMKPRDAYRYGYRMWLDEATSIPLKVELVSAEGEVLEQAMFTEIAYPESIDDVALRPAMDAKDFVWISHGAPTATGTHGTGSWNITELPPGFRTVVHEQQLMPGQTEPVEHMVFTDGLATVSAFMAPQGAPRKLKGMSRMGAMTAYARMVGDFHVTVVGEVPQPTVEMIANHLQHLPLATADPHVKPVAK